MKTKLILGFTVYSIIAFSQTKVEKHIAVQPGSKLIMNFDYPELIKLQTWDKNEILITGTVSINEGENDNAFELQVKQEGNTIAVTSVIKDKENLPKRIVIKQGETEYVFRAKDTNDPEVQKFFAQHGREYSYMSNGLSQHIKLNVFVPEQLSTETESKFGMVEVGKFNAPLLITAKHGGIDAVVNPGTTGLIIARTQFGEIFTNLGIKFNSENTGKTGRWTSITAKPGVGPAYSFESKFGNVYLRKGN